MSNGRKGKGHEETVQLFGGGGNFATIDKEAIEKKCTDEGYILAKDCRVQVGMQVAEYCPYDHKYVMCCGLEYAYTKCTYPLKPDGYCGGKYKCACDTVKYPFWIIPPYNGSGMSDYRLYRITIET